MSTSISLTISAESNEPAAGKSLGSGPVRGRTAARYSHQLLRPNTSGHLDVGPSGADEPLGQRHTGLGSSAGAGQTFIGQGASKLKRWRQQGALRDSSSDSVNSCDNGESKADDFYEEVDERMSRNSLEYPDQQAKYIDKWLAESAKSRRAPSSRSVSFDDNDDSEARVRGNVIGIRGFSSDSFIADSRRRRDKHKRLKRAYATLQAEHEKLKCRLEATATAPGQQAGCRHELEMEQLKALVARQGKRLGQLAGQGNGPARQLERICDICMQGATKQNMEAAASGGGQQNLMQIKDLELKLALLEQEHATTVERLREDNELLRSQLGGRDSELECLKREVRNLSLEAHNRRYLNLQQENAKLREANERDQRDYRTLKVNYEQLEARLRALAEDQKVLGEEGGEEHRRLMVELCRLQVYQPKLEMILETEQKIKLELEARLGRLGEENSELREKIVTLEGQLNHERLQKRAFESNEIERLRNEALKWQANCQRLREEKVSLDEALRASQMKVVQLDARQGDQLEAARDAYRIELERAVEVARRIEGDKLALASQLAETSDRLTRCEIERDKLTGELLELHQELARLSATCDGNNSRQQQGGGPITALETVTSQLKQCETKSASLEAKLRALGARNHELMGELKLSRSEVDQLKRQLCEQKRRFAMQQKAFDELRERKEKELAKLRVDLNYEQYNRQISLRGIEKELRSSLKELESMKWRFSKRLGSGGGGAAAKNESSLCPATPDCARPAQSNDQSAGAPSPSPPSSPATTMQADGRQQRCETSAQLSGSASCCRRRRQEQKGGCQEEQGGEGGGQEQGQEVEAGGKQFAAAKLVSRPHRARAGREVVTFCDQTT